MKSIHTKPLALLSQCRRCQPKGWGFVVKNKRPSKAFVLHYCCKLLHIKTNKILAHWKGTSGGKFILFLEYMML